MDISMGSTRHESKTCSQQWPSTQPSMCRLVSFMSTSIHTSNALYIWAWVARPTPPEARVRISCPPVVWGACCMDVCICMHMHEHACICWHTHSYARICMHMDEYACTCTHMLAFACVCMHMHTYACICKQIHAYACRYA